MNTYLIHFNYDSYCQGWESSWTTVLVHADTYDKAVEKIEASVEYVNATHFINRTIL